MPIALGGVQIDCSITKGCVQPKQQSVGPGKDARLRLWPAGSPWIRPGTFLIPCTQRWFSSYDADGQRAGATSTACEIPADKSIYYHWGLDTGGAEGLVDVDRGHRRRGGRRPDMDTIKPARVSLAEVKPRYDVVYLLDGRGWYYRYSHLLRSTRR